MDDIEAMYAYRSHPATCLFQSYEPKSLADVKIFIESTSNKEFDKPGWYQIGIALRQDGTLIGDCGIHVLEHDTRIVEIGITIAPIAQSKGYATETLRAVFQLLFGELKKHRVFASVDPLNLSSMALMSRLGMRKEGHFVQSLWLKDRWADDVVFAMLASEWQHLHSSVDK
jgi:RimJ/RimL family protein N-acetyltransferase